MSVKNGRIIMMIQLRIYKKTCGKNRMELLIIGLLILLIIIIHLNLILIVFFLNRWGQKLDLYSCTSPLLSQIVKTSPTFNKKIKKLFLFNRKSIEYRLNYITGSWWIKVARKNFFPALCETRKIEIMKEFYQESASVGRDTIQRNFHIFRLHTLERACVQIMYCCHHSKWREGISWIRSQ